jgi:hypothetical protein
VRCPKYFKRYRATEEEEEEEEEVHSEPRLAVK